jgi:hypothetical protein
MKARLLAALALGACAAPPPPAPAELPPLPRDPGFFLRQELRFTYGESSGALETVVQSRCGVLTIVGLAPFGARVFTLVQRESALEVKLHLPGSWPFPPENIARDVHRALLVPLPREAPAAGERALVYGGERVLERWEKGKLIERRLVPDAPPGARGVTIVYRDGTTFEAPAQEIRLEDLDRGYALELRTREQRGLACPPE